MEKKFDIYKYWLSVLIVYLVIVLAIAAAGCKTKDKNKEQHSTKVEVESVSTTLTTTVIDTVVKLPGSTVTASEPLTQIVSGDTLQAENNGTTIKAYYNKATGNLHVVANTAPKDVAVKATQTQATKTNTKAKVETKDKVKTTTVKSDISGNIKLGIVLLILCLLAGLFIYWRIKGLPLIS